MTAYDIAVERISRIPIPCDDPRNCKPEHAANEIRRVIDAIDDLTFHYNASTKYVYKIDGIFEETGYAMASLVRVCVDEPTDLAEKEFVVSA